VLKLSRLPSGRPEIFASIQGEGPTRGVASVFVRLAMCNLRCGWCDTKYTWDWDHYDRRTEVVDLDSRAVARHVERLRHRNVVITGGEPLLQQTALGPLVGDLKSRGRRIEVETNATIVPVAELATVVEQWNVSPKLANSGNQLGIRKVDRALRSFASRPNAYFKLVVSDLSDLDEIQRLVDDYGIHPSHVILMPEAQETRTLSERARWLIPVSQAAGYDFSPRLQIALWGPARGR
jgi:7-carboxy-7-deazaguanine synthase